MSRRNIFTSLHWWASSQDENFITETFVFLLNYFADKEKPIATKALQFLVGNNYNFNEDHLAGVSITSQLNTEHGRPDIEIKTNDFIAYIEVKVDSEFGHKQLKRYKKELFKYSDIGKCLSTITRYPHIHNSDIDEPDIPLVQLRWHNIVDFLSRHEPENEVSKFLRDQFVNFLIERGVAMDTVSWEMVNGLKSFKSLIDMIGEALASNKIPVYGKSPAWNWYGYYIDKKKFFVGIYLDNPNMLTFNTEVSLKDNITNNDIKFGIIEDGSWENYVDLNSEEVHFFAKSKANQIQCIEKFVKDSYEYASTLVD